GANEMRDVGAERGEPAQHLRRAVREIVDAGDGKAGRLEGEPGVRCDVAGRAGEQDHGKVDEGSGDCPGNRRAMPVRTVRQAGDSRTGAYNPGMLEARKALAERAVLERLLLLVNHVVAAEPAALE